MPITLYTVDEFRERLRVDHGVSLDRTTLSSMCKKREIQALIAGRAYLIPQSEIDVVVRVARRPGRPRRANNIDKRRGL